MFKPSEEPISKEIETVIGPTVQVDGNFNSKGNVVIEGGLKGTLKTNKNVKIGDNAHINANITADNAIVAGEIKGNLKIKGALEVKGSAKIIGDIEAKVLSIENGALLNGRCTMIGEEVAPEPKEENDAKKKLGK